MPVFAGVKVDRDFHVEVGRALYSAPKEYLGCHLDARADSRWSSCTAAGSWSRSIPASSRAGRSTDPADLPAEKTTYAMRDVG